MENTEIEEKRNPMTDNKDKKSKQKAKEAENAETSDAAACYLASKDVLADWNRPEEDEAWADL